MSRKIHAELLSPELTFIMSRSGGPGGQNVNKVNTKVTLKFHVNESSILTEEEKRMIYEKLASKIASDGTLTFAAQEKRSQLQNKQAVLEKLDRALTKVFEKRKKRKTTRPTKASKEERIKRKKQVSEKKQWRKPL